MSKDLGAGERLLLCYLLDGREGEREREERKREGDRERERKGEKERERNRKREKERGKKQETEMVSFVSP